MQPKLQWTRLDSDRDAAVVAGFLLLTIQQYNKSGMYTWRVQGHKLVKNDTGVFAIPRICAAGSAPSLLAAEAKAEFAARRLLAADRKNIRLIAGSPARGKEK